MLYHFKDGSPSRYPTSKDDAIKHKTKKYSVDKKCGICRSSTIKFTSTDNCPHCQRLKATVINNVIMKGDDQIRMINGKPTFLFDNFWDDLPDGWYTEIMDAVNLIRSGHATLSGEPCRNHGHIGLTSTENGRCYYCSLDLSQRRSKSPRKTALAAGEKWYTPDEDCLKCGTRSQRYVANGRCSGCHPTRSDANETARFMADNASMVMDKATAKAFGFKVYRTGNSCRKGHTGFRYVSTGNCVDCIKEGG